MASGATRRGALLAALGVLLLPQLARAQTCPSGFNTCTWCGNGAPASAEEPWCDVDRDCHCNDDHCAGNGYEQYSGCAYKLPVPISCGRNMCNGTATTKHAVSRTGGNGPRHVPRSYICGAEPCAFKVRRQAQEFLGTLGATPSARASA